MFELSGVNYEEVLEQRDSILVRVIASSSYRGFELSGLYCITEFITLRRYYIHYIKLKCYRSRPSTWLIKVKGKQATLFKFNFKRTVKHKNVYLTFHSVMIWKYST